MPGCRLSLSPRSAIVACTLVSYLLAAVGLPLPVRAAKERGEPFPCQDSACGCRTAEQCWRSCQCLTLEQRLAWARARGITPPAYVAETAAAEGGGCCCQESTTSSCCQSPKNAAPAAADGPRGPLFSAHRCQGLSTIWISSGVVPLAHAIAPVILADTMERLVVAESRLPALNEWSPPTPPPRLFVG